MKTVNIELTVDQLAEIHLTMLATKERLRQEIKIFADKKDRDIQAICVRQLERVTPICYYIESVMREQYETN
jgi:hypothetical protein